ncbi:MAG TPA: hypothetical protein VE398_17200 [Acidobacteriota bacterium]|nr:hypothetical protein [Acidobacteriota bacterium]
MHTVAPHSLCYIYLMRAAFLLFAAIAFCGPQIGAAATLDGKVVVEGRNPPQLQLQDKRIQLSIADDSIGETLRDHRVAGKQMRLVGKFRDDGSFEVTDFFVVHPDGLYRIIYFCNVCHITAFKPGICICCQQPTELEEVPLTDPRVYHESVK